MAPGIMAISSVYFIVFSRSKKYPKTSSLKINVMLTFQAKSQREDNIMFKSLIGILLVSSLCLPVQAIDEDRFIEIFAQAYGEAMGKATSEYLIQRYEQRYGVYGAGQTWSGYRTYAIPGLFPEVSERYLSASELQGLSKTALWVMRNEVYARHGRPFSDPTVRRYFNSQPWYRVDPRYLVPSDDVARLTALEKANTALIAQQEKRAGSGPSRVSSEPQANSMSYWYRNTVLTEAHLAGKTAWELLVMRNQIYARYGRRFTYKPLQDFFQQQSWYQINPRYSDNLLSPIEKRNAGTIMNYEKKMGYM
jgi:hypothetical protein